MPRKWGARAARHAEKRIAEANNIPVHKVPGRKVFGRIKTRPITIARDCFPGTKVKARHSFGTDVRATESVEAMLKRMKQLSKKIRAPKGVKKVHKPAN